MGKKSKSGKKARKIDNYEHVEEEEKVLGELLKPLNRVKGYKAAIILTHSGEILASDSTDKGFNLQEIGLVFNNIFKAAHEASEKIGLETCLETSIKTPKGIIIMKCSGVSAQIHFHLIAVLSSDGNQALAKMELDKTIPLILDNLT